MKLYSWFISLILVSSLSFSEEISIASINSKWFFDNYKTIRLKIENGTDFETIPIINTICILWKFRDGAIGNEISSTIAKLFIYKPIITFSWFEREKKEFDSWIERIPYDLLTDYSGSQKEKLEALKIDLINALEAYISKTDNENHKALANKLINKLIKTQVSKIE